MIDGCIAPGSPISMRYTPHGYFNNWTVGLLDKAPTAKKIDDPPAPNNRGRAVLMMSFTALSELVKMFAPSVSRVDAKK